MDGDVLSSDVLCSDESAGLLALERGGRMHVFDAATGTTTEQAVLAPTELDMESASGVSTAINLANTVLGAGIVALPFAYASMGVVVGSIMVVCVAVLADFSLRLLVRTSAEFGFISFAELGHATWGTRGRIGVQATLLTLLVGSLVAYLVIIGEALSPLARRLLMDDPAAGPVPWYAETWVILSVHTVCVILPLVLVRKVDYLKYSSVLSLCAVVLLVVFVVTRSFTMPEADATLPAGAPPPPPPPLPAALMQGQSRARGGAESMEAGRFGWQLFLGIPIVCFVFTSHPNVLLLYYQLKARTPERMGRIIHGSVAGSGVLYVTIGVFGYLTFGSETKGNIVANYDDSGDVFGDVCRVALAVAISCSYPLISHPCLTSFDVLIVPSFLGLRTPSLRWHLEAVGLVGLTLGLAIAVPSIVLVFSLTGASAAVAICFVLPGLFFVKLSERSLFNTDMAAIVVLVGAGIVFGTIATVVILVDLFSGGTHGA